MGNACPGTVKPSENPIRARVGGTASNANRESAARATAWPGRGSFRNDVEGLRAVAVFLVLLFHLDFKWMPGGFVGVDVFYVISGYLITRNIVRDGATFQLSAFWWRRVRRLMPAVWVVSALTMIAALLLMTPEAAHGVAVSAIAAALCSSNILFWLQSGYWDTSSAFKPLLHTWSLGVEEQFYLVWPILLMAVRPLFGRRIMTGLFALLVVAELALSQWMVTQDASAAFYLMPFRITEFACGALITTVEPGIARLFDWRMRIGVAVAGLAAVFWSAFRYSGDTPFPGVAALLPALGAALIIAGGRNRSAGSRWKIL